MDTNKRKHSSIAMRNMARRRDKQAEDFPKTDEVRAHHLSQTLNLMTCPKMQGHWERKANRLSNELAREKKMRQEQCVEFDDQLRAHMLDNKMLRDELRITKKELEAAKLDSDTNRKMYENIAVAKLDAEAIHQREVNKLQNTIKQVKTARKALSRKNEALKAQVTAETNKRKTLMHRTRLQTKMLLHLASQSSERTSYPLIDSLCLVMPSLLRKIIAQATLGTIRAIKLFECQRAATGRSPLMHSHFEKKLKPYERAAQDECTTAYIEFLAELPKAFFTQLLETPASRVGLKDDNELFKSFASNRGYDLSSCILPMFNEFDICPFVTSFVMTPMHKISIDKEKKVAIHETSLSAKWGHVLHKESKLRDVVAVLKQTPYKFLRRFKFINGEWVMMRCVLDDNASAICNCKMGVACSCEPKEDWKLKNRYGMIMAMVKDESCRTLNEFAVVQEEVENVLYCKKIVSETGWLVENDTNNWRIRDYFRSIADHTKSQVSLDETLFMTYMMSKLYGSECEPVGMCTQFEWAVTDKVAHQSIGPPQHVRFWFDELMDLALNLDSNLYNQIAKNLKESMDMIDRHYSIYQAVLHSNCKLQSMLTVVSDLLEQLSIKTSPLVKKIRDIITNENRVIIDMKIDGKRVSLKEKYDPDYADKMDMAFTFHEYTNDNSLKTINSKKKTVIRLRSGVVGDVRGQLAANRYAPFIEEDSLVEERIDSIRRIETNNSAASGWASTLMSEQGHARMTLISAPNSSTSTSSYRVDPLAARRNERTPPRANISSNVLTRRQIRSPPPSPSVLSRPLPLTRSNAVETIEISSSDEEQPSPRYHTYDYTDDIIALRGTNNPNENVPISERLQSLTEWYQDTWAHTRPGAERTALTERYERLHSTLRDANRHNMEVIDEETTRMDQSSSDSEVDTDTDTVVDGVTESKEEEDSQMRETKEEEANDLAFQRMENGDLPLAQPDLGVYTSSSFVICNLTHTK